MATFVCNGAKLKCSMGSEQSELRVVHYAETVSFGVEFAANIQDYKPFTNIKPFGKCKSLANPIVAAATSANFGRLKEMPCIPNTTTPWRLGKFNVSIKGQPALMDDCKLFCAWAGMIEITDDGQKEQMGAAEVEKPIEIEVKSIKGNESAFPNETVTYTVSSYNISQVKDEDKDLIRWEVKVDGERERIPFLSGETIELNIKQEWAGKEILVMAKNFFGEFDENICQKTKIESKKITKLYWIDAETEEEIETIFANQKVRLCFETLGYKNNEKVQAKIKWSNNKKFANNSTELIFSGIVDEKRKAISEEIYEKDKNYNKT